MKKQLQILASITILLSLTTIGSCDKKVTHYGCLCEESGYLKRTVEIGPNKPTSTLSVHSEFGEFLADASCHADFELRFYWKDLEMALTDERPPVSYTLIAGIGYIPVDHSDEVIYKTTFGDYRWIVKKSAAVHPDLHEGTDYGIEVKYGSAVPDGDVVCILEVTYKEYKDAAYQIGCEDD